MSEGGWDSYGGLPVTREVLGEMVGWLLNWTGHEAPAPTVVPTSGGGVQLEWHMAGIDLEVEFQPSGKVGMLLGQDITEGDAGMLVSALRIIEYRKGGES